MKKLLLGALASATLLTGCATTGTEVATGALNTATSVGMNVGMSVFKTAVDTQCRAQINSYNAYKVVTTLMTDSQKTALENKVCGCVSEKAPQSVNLVDIGQAVIDEKARAQLAVTAVTKTINACVSEFTTGL